MWQAVYIGQRVIYTTDFIFYSWDSYFVELDWEMAI